MRTKIGAALSLDKMNKIVFWILYFFTSSNRV